MQNDPFEQMNRFFEQARRSMWNDRWDAPRLGAERESENTWGDFEANVTLESTDEGYLVLADLPGFEKEEIDLSFDGGVLTIRGESSVTEESEGRRHRRSRSVHEQLRVPGSVVVADIEASYHNGVLEVTLPTEGEDDDEHRIDID